MRSLLCTTGSDLSSAARRLGQPLHLTVALSLLAFLAIGCKDPVAPEGVLLRIEPTETAYSPADTVTVALRNVGSVFVAFEGCKATLQRRDGAEWVSLTPIGNAGLGCVDTIRGQLPAGMTVLTLVGVIPTGLQPGSYRYRMEAIVTEDGVAVPLPARLSAPFLVIVP